MAITSTLNITLIGDLAVGKDNLVHTLIGPTESYQSVVTETISNCKVNLNTLSGTPSSIKSLPVDLKGSNVILVCYDVSSQASYDNACKIWLKEAIKHSLTPHCQADIILVGLQSSNKKNIVDKETADKFAEEKGIEHLVVESANSEKVRKFFANIVKQHPVVEVENIFEKQNEHELKELRIKQNNKKKQNKALAIKIVAGIVLVAAIATAAVFLWPLIVGSAAIIAAASAISALTVAYLGIATSVAVFAATALTVASTGLVAFGGFLISKITNLFHKPSPIIVPIDEFEESKNDLIEQNSTVSDLVVAPSTYASLAKSQLAPSYKAEIQEVKSASHTIEDGTLKVKKSDIEALLVDLEDDLGDENNDKEFKGKTKEQIIAEAMKLLKEEDDLSSRLIAAK